MDEKLNSDVTDVINESEEARRQQDESEATRLAEQDAASAEQLKSEESMASAPETITGEQPFGGHKDDTALLVEPTGTALWQEEANVPLEDRSHSATESSAGQDTSSSEPPEPLQTVSPSQEAGIYTAGSTAVTDTSEQTADTQTLRSEENFEDTETTSASATEAFSESAPKSAEEVNTETPDTVVAPTLAQTPSLSVSPVSGYEDSPIALDIQSVLQDTDGGNETLSITISNVPDGVTLSAGTDNGDGTWTLSPDDLSGLTLSLPENSNDDFSLSVTATSTEDNGDIASTTLNVDVDVIGVADTPDLTASLASGAEDGPVAFNISGALTDTDGSESLSFVVNGVPDGASLSAGTDNGDGTWTLGVDDLDGLQFNPPENYSGDINLGVTAIATENDGDVATNVTSVSATITPVADAATVAAADASGFEDSSIGLSVSASLVDTTEALSVSISGIPNGATLNHGTPNSDGSWTVDSADLSNLSITPPKDYSGNMELTLTATSTESDGSIATSSANFNVHVTGVADTPDLTAGTADGTVTGNEDTALALNISSALNDTDGSETLSVTVADVPDNFTLSAGTDNGDGTWTLTQSQLDGLTISSPEDYSGSFSLNVTALSTEADGDTASAVTVIPVTFTAVADSPDLSADAASTLEDTTVALNIEALVTDDSEFITSVVISGVPDGASLSAGADNGDGSWTLTTDQLDGLTLTPPANSNVDFNLTVTSTSAEPNGSTATSETTLPVHITGVADTPNLSVDTAAGNEDSWIDLTLDSSLTDTDSSESLAIVIDGLPDGARLNAGTEQPDGSWQLTPTDMDGLQVLPPENSNEDFALSVTAISTEDDGNSASTTKTLNVHVTGVADTPALTASLASGAEDGPVAFNISGALTDTDGSESLSFVVNGVPDGASLSAGTDNGDGTWTLSVDDLDGLQFNPPENYSGDINLGVTAVATENDGDVTTNVTSVSATITPVADAATVTAADASGFEDSSIDLSVSASLVDSSETLSVSISGIPNGATLNHGTPNSDGSWTVDSADLNDLSITPPKDFSGNMELTLTATSTESDGSIATSSANFNVHVTGVADTPDLSAGTADGTVTGNEDTALPLNISSTLKDTDGSETLSITVADVPDNFTLSAGTDNGDGTWTLTQGQLDGLTISSPEDYSGSFSLNVTALSTEADGDTASAVTEIPVTFTAVADEPDLSADAASTLEDTTVALNIEAVVTDDSEFITSVVISGVPDGASLSAGADNGDGSWTLTTDQLDGLTLTPPANSNVDFNLTVTSTSAEPNGSTATSETTLPVHITGVADTPVLDADDVAGREDKWIKLDVDSSLTDVDSSESLHLVIEELPSEAKLNVGTQQADGSWEVDAADIAKLKIRPPKNFSGAFDISITAVSTENDGDTASISSSIKVDVDAVADRANVRVRNVKTVEDNDLDLDLKAWVADDSEHIQSTTITGVPLGFTILGGTDLGEGKWSVPSDDLDSLSLQAPENYSGTVNLKFTVTTVEPENGDTATRSKSFKATFTADADEPVISGNDVTTNEDTPVQLDFGAGLADQDGSESLSVQISGVPEGATLSAGTDNGDGTWTVAPDDLATLELTPPENFSGDIALSMTATSTEASNSDTATSTVDVNVHVIGVADATNLATMDTIGREDTDVPLTVRASLTDTDGSESLFVEFSDVPEGAILSAGEKLDNGNWQVAVEDLDGLSIRPPEDSSDDFTLSVRSLSVEADGDQQYSDPQTIQVSLRGVADTPDVHVGTAQGNEDTAIALNFHAESTDADGSESISYVITGVPQGASLSDGVYIGNGRWSVGEDDMPDLTITPPEDFSGSFELGITVVAQEADGHQTREEHTLPITVDSVVDAPSRGSFDGSGSYGSASGKEDSAIHLNVDPGLNDADGSETTLWVEVSGLPEGAELSTGTEVSDGVFRLTPDQFDGLTVTPPDNSDADFNLSVKAMIQDAGGNTAVTEGSLRVHVHADADTPSVAADNISGTEGNDIAAAITAELADTDGSESLSFIISGFEGTSVTPSAGINLGDGSFLVSGEQLEDLTFSSGDISETLSLNVTVNAIATEGENNDSAFSEATFALTIEPDSSTGGGGDGGGTGSGGGDSGSGGTGGGSGTTPTPTVSVTSPTGSEDTSFAVTIDADFADSASQTGIVISDLPEGATVNGGFYNPINQTWVIAGDDTATLEDLKITPPDDFSGTLNFTVDVAQTTPAGTTQTIGTNVAATIDPVVDAPRVSLGNTNGTEDTQLDLGLNVHTTDADGSESIVSIVISGLPAGASITGATDLGNGRYEVDPAHTDQVQFVPPANAHGDFSFNVETVVQESDGSQKTFTRGAGVHIDAAVDSATLSAENVAGFEDAAVSLNVSAELMDTDGSEVIAVTISNVPDDALFSAGSNNGDGSWTFTPAELNDLKFTAPPDASGQFAMTLNAYTLETSTGQTTTTSQGFTVDIQGVADAVPVDGQDTAGLEDTAIPIELDYILADTDGSESVTAILTGIPEGSQLSSGTLQADGSWAVPGDTLDTLHIIPPQHLSGDIDIHAEIVTTEADGDTASRGIDVTVTVEAVADAPALEVQDAAGNEDSAISLDIESALTDSTEVLSVVIDGVPNGAVLSAGTDNGDGTWTLAPEQLTDLTITPATNMSGDFTLTVTATSVDGTSEASVTQTMDISVAGVADTPNLTVHDAAGSEDSAIALNITTSLTDSSEVLSVVIDGVPEGAELSAGTNNGGGSWTLSPAQLTDLTITPAANASDDITLTVTATSVDGTSEASVTQTLDISVAGVADTPNLTVQNAAGSEESAIALGIAASLTDNTEILSVVIDGVPEGAVLSAGTDNGGGSWTLSPAQLTDLTFTPAENMSGDFTFTVTAASVDGSSEASISETLNVSVAGVADDPTLTVHNVTGNEDSAIALDIAASLTDSSEVLSVVIDGVPDGAVLSAGTDNGGGSWTLTEDNLQDLTLTPAENDASDFDLSVTAISTDGESSTEVTDTFTVTVQGQPDTPVFEVEDASGTQGQPLSLDIDVQAAAPGETLSVTIADVPDGATLSTGVDNADGSWTLTEDQANDVQISFADNYSGSFTLDVSVDVTQEGNTASFSETMDITVAPTVVSEPAGSADYTSMLAGSGGSEGLGSSISDQAMGYVNSLGMHTQGMSQDESAAVQSIDQALLLADAASGDDALDISGTDELTDVGAESQELMEPSADTPAEETEHDSGMEAAAIVHDF